MADGAHHVVDRERLGADAGAADRHAASMPRTPNAVTPHALEYARGVGRWALVLVVVAGCEARLARGSGCATTSECSAPLVCAAGRCRIECVTHRDCPLGTFCRLGDETAVDVQVMLPNRKVIEKTKVPADRPLVVEE